jgi:hypothetical protein
MPEVTYQILGWGFVIVAAVTPVLIILMSIRNYRLGAHDFEISRFKAIAAFCIWLFLTLAMSLLLGFVAYVVSHAISQNPSVRPHPTLSFVAIHAIYFAACYLLVDWVSRRNAVEPINHFRRAQHNKALQLTAR